MLNKFLVAGRMTADPEIKTIGENRLCKFTIACDRPKRKGEENPETDFFPCTAWNRNADVIVDWFGKGDMVTLVGSVHNNRYERTVRSVHLSRSRSRRSTSQAAKRSRRTQYRPATAIHTQEQRTIRCSEPKSQEDKKMETTIIAISNQKGGVGKSTTAYNLGACLALNHDKKVLLIDFDPQANLSEYLKYEPDGNPTMTQLIMSFYAGNPVTAETAQKAIRHSETAGVDYIPADINLANAETLMVTMISKEHILRRILTEDVVGAYDFVLIDCLPSLGTLLINALTAADRVLIPVQTQKFSMDGLQSLEALTQLVRANTNPKLNLIGVLPTMVDRTKVSRTAIETLNEKYGDMLFRTSISKSIEAAKSSENGTPLCLTGHKLGQEYDELAQEVLSRC